ncbi:spatacsin [Ixodes scapularis]|uniref:spatacsin n=1 Tax=Ixodes scapularis TaxID=6945 RepID=UPI001C3920BF|nr:spatacsin [Ixodes scapularis]
MTLTLLKKLKGPRSEPRAHIVSPSPLLVSYCFIHESNLKVVDLKTDRVISSLRDVQDCIWRDGLADADELAVVSSGHEVSLVRYNGHGCTYKQRSLRWNSVQRLAKVEWVLCHGDNFVFLINRSLLLCTLLIGDALETVWHSDLGCEVVRVRVIDSEVYVLTSQASIVGYSLQTGLRSSLLELQACPFDGSQVTDFVLCPEQGALAVCVGHARLYSVVAEKPAFGESWRIAPTPKDGVRVTAFVKKKTLDDEVCATRNWKLLLDVSDEAANSHVMWMGEDRRIVFCYGAGGLQRVVAFEMGAGGAFSPIVEQADLSSHGNFVLMHDTRSTLQCAPAFLFAYNTATLTFGAASRRLLAEVMEQTGRRAAETLSQLNRWQAMAMDLSVLLRGVRHRQLDMLAFFLKAKEDAMELQLTRSRPKDTGDAQQLELLASEVNAWDSVLTELGRAVVEALGDLSSKHFSQQLLQLVLSSVVRLLAMALPRELNDTWPERVQLRKRMSVILAGHLGKLRSQIHHGSVLAAAVPELKDAAQANASEWDKLTEKELMLRCVHQGNIPEGQYHLLRRRAGSVEPLLSTFQEVALREALRRLREDDFPEAERLLTNVGFFARVKMRELLLLSRDRRIRRVLRRELVRMAVLTEADSSLLDKVAAIEECFPQEDVGQASWLASQKRAQLRLVTPQASELVVAVLKPAELPPRQAPKAGGDTWLLDESPYFRVAPAWLHYWDADTLDRVLAEGRAGSPLLDMQELGGDNWRLLLEHGHLERALSGPLPSEALEASSCMSHVHRLLLAALARGGQIHEDVLEDFGDLLGLMGESGLKPSQLARVCHGPVTPEDFVHRMVHYCLRERLHHFLYLFLTDLRPELPPLCPQCNGCFVQALRDHWQWLDDPQDVAKAERAIVSLARSLPAKGSAVPRILEPAVVGADLQDISLYQLLQKGTPFEIAGLFAWQTTNACQVDSGGSLMPHFSLPSLRDKFGLREELSFPYYLHKGRPCAAAFKFLAQELLLHGSLSTKRIRSACHRALRLAEQRPHDARAVAASVAFAEILGMDTRSFRVTLRTTRLALTSSPGCQSRLSDILRVLRRSKDAMQEVLLQATLALEEQLTGAASFSPMDEKCSSGILLLLRFATEHGFEVPDVALRLCAAANDWLGFLLWAQLLQCPRTQVLDLVQLFQDGCLREHLSKALSVVSSLQPSKHHRRDLRASLYARIGLQDPSTRGHDPSESAAEQDAVSVCSSEGIDGAAALNTEPHYSTDLVELMLQCHCSGGTMPGSSGMAWQSLLRAAVVLKHQTPCVIAGCCPDAPLGSCLALWLKLCSGGEEAEMPEDGRLEFTLAELQQTMEAVVKRGRLRTLLLGLQLFQPRSPLVTLVEFLVAFFLERNRKRAEECLERLKRKFTKMEAASTPGVGLTSLPWLRETSQRLLGRAFGLCRSHLDLAALAAFCDELHGGDKMPHLHKLLASLSPASLLHEFDWSSLWGQPGEKAATLARLVSQLNQTGRFKEALALARAAGLPLADVALQQLELRFEDRSATANDTFWEDCDQVLQENFVDPALAFDFLKGKTLQVEGARELYEVGHRALQWLRRSAAWGSPEAQRWEARVWLWCVRSGAEPTLEANPKPDPLVAQPPPSPGACVTLDDSQQVAATEKLIDELLSRGHFCKACQLAFLFGCSTSDLELLLTCIRLAQGTQSFDNLDPRIQLRISEPAPVLAHRLSVVASMSAVDLKSLEGGEDSPERKTLQLLERITRAAKKSQQLCQRVLLTFTLSLNLGCSYSVLALESDPVALLGNLVGHSLAKMEAQKRASGQRDGARQCCSADFALAKKLVAVFGIPDDRVANFLFHMAMDAIRGNAVASKAGILEVWDLALELCPDPSLLGNLLLRARVHDLRALSSNPKALSVEVELCVRAHSCFLEACSMEGISRVLHRCHRLTPCLVAGRHFSLLVSLLTGMARYSEMAYVFDLLLQNHHFELLFQRGMDKVPYLRVALLDYLKHRASTDPDLYSMLTLNFNMHREIAESLELTALTKMKKLVTDGPMAWSPQEQRALETVLQDLADAAESYVKAECLLRAQSCGRKAQLVALQLRYFASQLVLINLEPSAAMTQVARHPNFFEAHIVAEAYGLQGWHSAALFSRVLLDGDWGYLADFCSVCELTSQHAHELALRYQNEAAGNAKCRDALEKLLERLPCVLSRLQLAQKLGFARLASQTLEAHPYLRDYLDQRT